MVFLLEVISNGRSLVFFNPLVKMSARIADILYLSLYLFAYLLIISCLFNDVDFYNVFEQWALSRFKECPLILA